MTEEEQYNPAKEDRGRANDVVKAIMLRLNILTVSVVVLLGLLVGIGVYVWISAGNTQEALCTFRSDLQDRIIQTQTFLDHPEQFPQFNDPDTIALIQAQLDNQRATVRSLAGLGCH